MLWLLEKVYSKPSICVHLEGEPRVAFLFFKVFYFCCCFLKDKRSKKKEKNGGTMSQISVLESPTKQVALLVTSASVEAAIG